MAIKIIKKQVLIDDVASEAEFYVDIVEKNYKFLLSLEEAKELVEALIEKIK